MLRFFQLVLLCVFCITNFVYCEVLDIQSTSEILPYITEDSLVVFDIGETLLTTKQSVGDDYWLCDSLKRYQEEGLSFEEARAKALPEYMKLQNMSQVKAVESLTSALVHKLQCRGIKVIGLTSRRAELAYTTLRQLRSIGIDLDRNPVKIKNLNISSYLPVNYVEGVIFAQNNHKGEILFDMVKFSNYPLKKVIFIDDKMKYIKQVEEMCRAHDIEYVGFRYGANDSAHEAYSSEIAQIQRKYFDEILSNEAAEKILLAGRQAND